MKTMYMQFASVGALLLLAPSLLAQTKSQVSSHVSSGAERKDLAITVYNDGFGLVRETREQELGTGRVALEFRDVASQIQPETVSIKPLGSSKLSVLEQNYRYDVLTSQKLLEKHVGKQLKIYRYNEKLGRDEAVVAELLSVEGGTPIVKIGNEITYNFGGRFAFAELPPNLIAKPTLVWLLDSQTPKPSFEVTYLSRGFSWQADYVLTLDEKDQAGDLTSWVTLRNTSGTSYENAKLKLVAGNVQRVMAEYARRAPGAMYPTSAPAPTQFNQESFFEYHLYSLQRPTTLLQNEQKQVSLLDAAGIKVDKKLIFFGQSYYFRSRYGSPMSNQKVGVYLDIENREKNHLGMPMPKGVVRVYKADKSGAKQFVGEDRIEHTPRDERVRIKMGEAFDVVGERKQMKWTSLGACESESDWEVSLRNHKDSAVTVEDVEPIGGDWSISQNSHPFVRKDAQTFSFTVAIPARGTTKIAYKVRIRWC